MKPATRIKLELIGAQQIATIAARMPAHRAAEILTWTDEPELLAEPGDIIPTFHPDVIAAARLISERDCAEILDGMQWTRRHAV